MNAMNSIVWGGVQYVTLGIAPKYSAYIIDTGTRSVNYTPNTNSNNSGNYVVNYSVPNSGYGFKIVDSSGGTLIDFGNPFTAYPNDAWYVWATHINDNNQICGHFSTYGYLSTYSFTINFDGSQKVVIPVVGAVAYCIDNNGRVVGGCPDGTIYRNGVTGGGFVYKNGIFNNISNLLDISFSVMPGKQIVLDSILSISDDGVIIAQIHTVLTDSQSQNYEYYILLLAPMAQTVI